MIASTPTFPPFARFNILLIVNPGLLILLYTTARDYYYCATIVLDYYCTLLLPSSPGTNTAPTHPFKSTNGENNCKRSTLEILRSAFCHYGSVNPAQ